MLKIFTKRRSNCYDDSVSVDPTEQPRRISRTKKSTILGASKNTKHLDLALNKSNDSNSNLSQRYTRFPTSTKNVGFQFCRNEQLRVPPYPNSPIDSEPTHQRLVITGNQRSNHQRFRVQRIMPKNKPSRSDPSGSGASGVPTPKNGSTDVERSGSFMNKPVRGWLHPDRQISENGICYGVRYVGCLEVTASMKSLDFDTRSQIAKECINKVCESGGLKSVDKRRKVDKKIQKMLGDKPNMEFAGSNVNLTITSKNLNLTIMETGELIAEHEMPNVSFASGGDPDTLDFVAYVAKDPIYGRACFVLECGGGLAQDVITTIGQAFELRFKQYLSRGPSSSTDFTSRPLPAPSLGSIEFTAAISEDPEYYNDLPGKMPPEISKNGSGKAEVSCDTVVSSRSDAKPTNKCSNVQNSSQASKENLKKGASADNLIDLNEEIRVPSRKPEPEYVNCDVIAKNKVSHSDEATSNGKRSEDDPFDLQPFEGTLPSSNLLKPLSPVRNNFSPPVDQVLSTETPSENQASGMSCNDKQMLSQEIWYHGPISRKESESLVVNNGDFLVRESQGSPGQYVLTGMQGGLKKHLLLVDPEGVVRTKDRTFESVSHLINYHSRNGLPIIAADSALILSKPIRMKP